MDRREFIRLCGEAVFAGAAAALGWNERALAMPVTLDDTYLSYCKAYDELTEKGPIVLPDGNCRCGWMRHPMLDLNFEDARFSTKTKMRLAMKKWDMYHMYTPTHAIHLLIAWTAYASFFTAFVYDRRADKVYEESSFLSASPEIPLMRDSTGGKTEYVSGDVRASFEVEGETRRLRVRFPGFAKGNLSADIDLFYPAAFDSIASSQLTAPMRCYFGHKINAMTATGRMELNGETFEMNPETCFGALDFGRGYYPPKLFWYWATASGRHTDGKLIGFNLGYGNRKYNTAENALFYDGKLTKVGETECVEAPDDDPMRAWSVRDAEGLVDLKFAPVNVRRVEVNMGQRYSRGRPCVGIFSGTMRPADGKTIEVENLFGQFEWIDSKW